MDCVGTDAGHVIVTAGDPERLGRALSSASRIHAPDAVPSGKLDPRVCHALERRIIELLAAENQLAPEELLVHEPLETYGVDSIVIMNVTRALESGLGSLPKTLFFRCRTIAELAAHLARTHGVIARSWLGVHTDTAASLAVEDPTGFSAGMQQASPPVADRQIAIIGVAGRYPGSANLLEYWENLAAGRDCIGEIPSDRWDYRQHFAPSGGRPGTSYTKWGGFLTDIDKFDPLFFKIAPREAAFLDPQERLFLETTWQAMEDAGYSRSALQGRAVGVFAGVMWGQYQLLRAEVGGGIVSPSSLYASVANRVSYCLDLHGPSFAVDSMCSSSLTALHLACESIRRGECELAFAGGVNLSIHPHKYETLSFQRFASSEGKCRAFGQGGDGYVPGEGVGAVLLKELEQALADGDRIYGVVRGIALNHGGKTSGFSVPSPSAQAAVIGQALRRAGVRPEQVSYVEAHGTGTALGDPIELDGLSEAYTTATQRAQPCALGSVKSNIGHLEAAAGIAGLTKVLLQLQHSTLVPSIHAEQLNPHIDFASTPFVVQRQSSPWLASTAPRIAALSSFGAGGANAHVLVEEAPRSRPPEDARWSKPGLRAVLLSAQSAAQLDCYAARLLEHVQGLRPPTSPPLESELADTLREIVATLLGLSAADVGLDQSLDELGLDAVALGHLGERFAERCDRRLALEDRSVTLQQLVNGLAGSQGNTAPNQAELDLELARLAFVSQVGRDAFERRVAFLATDLEHLERLLKAFIAGDELEGLERPGRVTSSNVHAEGATLEQRINEDPIRLRKLVHEWLRGANIDWARGWPPDHPRRTAFPSYPFARERHWIREAKPRPDRAEPNMFLAPSVRGVSWFEGTLSPDDWLVREHRLGDVATLPLAGVVALVASSSLRAWGTSSVQLTDLVISRALSVVTDTPVMLRLEAADAVHADFDLRAGGIICARGQLLPCPGDSEVSLADVAAPAAAKPVEPKALYQRLAEAGVAHGPSYRVLRNIRSDGQTAAATLEAASQGAAQAAEVIALDAGLQLLGSFEVVGGTRVRGLPNRAQRVLITERLRTSSRVVARARGEGVFDIVWFDAEGRLCAEIAGLSVAEAGVSRVASAPPATHEIAARAVEVVSPVPDIGSEALSLVPQWIAVEETTPASKPSSGCVLVISSSKHRDLPDALCIEHADRIVHRLFLGRRRRRFSLYATEVPCGDAAAIENFARSLRGTTFERIYFLQEPVRAEDVLRGAAASRALTLYYRVAKSLLASAVLTTGVQLRFVGCDGYEVAGLGGQNCSAAAAFAFTSALAKEARLEASVADVSSAEISRPTGFGGWVVQAFWLLIGILTLGAFRRPTESSVRCRELARSLARLPAVERPRPYAVRGDDIWERQLEAAPQDDVAQFGFESDRVYVVSGGASGIGLEIAKHLARRCGARLALLGRSPLGDTQRRVVESVRDCGGTCTYFSVDVTDVAKLELVAADIRSQLGEVAGVVHAAGVLRDCPLAELHEATFREVLAAKVDGSLALWQVFHRPSLDLFVFCSSAGALDALPGQTHYAAGNAFQDALAHHLARSSATRVRSIDWGYWGSVGAAATPLHRKRFAQRGIHAIEPAEAMQVLEQALLGDHPQRAFIKLAAKLAEPTRSPAPVESTRPATLVLSAPPNGAAPPDEATLLDLVVNEVLAVVQVVLGIPETRVRPQLTFEDVGMDSIAALEIQKQLERSFGPLSATLLFEHHGPLAVAHALLREHRGAAREFARSRQPRSHASEAALPAPSQISAATTAASIAPQCASADAASPAPPAVDTTLEASGPPAADDDAIAIIGIAGRYPGADDLTALWSLLREARTSVSKVPADRWIDEQDQWGGFIRDPWCFDADFFRIVPREAEMLDPQERQFLEVAWSAVENAGYVPEALDAERKVGVYVGVMNPLHEFIAGEAWGQGNHSGARSSYWSIANRVSYLLDLKGPSLGVDTACSSSSVAIHLAIQSLRRGECHVAIAGGVNLVLHPRHYETYQALGMLSPTGACRPFGSPADGMVVGEGVGALLLKPLRRAQADGDHIHAVIRGSAVNTNGRTHGYTVPSPATQAAVMRDALADSRLAAAQISYVEAGLGTELGDPIEARGLSSVHAGRPDALFVGSLKSNVGHLESASGVAALTKVVLQLQHETLVPTLGVDRLNPRVTFPQEIVLNTRHRPWTRDARTPRRAAIGSFGAGGTNSYLIVEEAPAAAPRALDSDEGVVLLSARSPERLWVSVRQLRNFLRDMPNAAASSLADIAYTTQLGRVALSHRLAIVASDVPSLLQKLEGWLAQRNDSDTFSGKVEDVEEVAVPRSAPLRALARAWVTGSRWPEWAAAQGRRIPLPTYPFARVRHCVLRAAAVATTEAHTDLAAESALASVCAERQPEWIETDVDWSERALESYTGLVIFGVDGSIREAVRAQTQDAFPVVLVAPGRRYERLDSLTYRIRPQAREDFVALLDALWQEGIVPDRILFLWPESEATEANAADVPSLDSLELLQTLLLAESLPRTSRLLMARLEPYPSEEPGDAARAESTPSAGLCVTRCELGDGAWNDDAIEALLLELACDAPRQHVRWYQGRRWVQQTDAVEAAGRHPAIKSEIRGLRSNAADPSPVLRLPSARSDASQIERSDLAIQA
jgi:acyl transferase domain-containing protein/NAD(P)-dependent dehydrogenase (short-subunit alcohol dehydrogenase family)